MTSVKRCQWQREQIGVTDASVRPTAWALVTNPDGTRRVRRQPADSAGLAIPRLTVSPGWAKCIGHVGALALALGVSGAAAAPAVAWADESSTSDSVSEAPDSDPTSSSSASRSSHLGLPASRSLMDSTTTSSSEDSSDEPEFRTNKPAASSSSTSATDHKAGMIDSISTTYSEPSTHESGLRSNETEASSSSETVATHRAGVIVLAPVAGTPRRPKVQSPLLTTTNAGMHTTTTRQRRPNSHG